MTGQASCRRPDSVIVAEQNQPLLGLKEIQRVLKPGGLLAVTIPPKEKWVRSLTPPVDIFTLYNTNDIIQLLLETGFHDLQVEKLSCSQRIFSRMCVSA